MIGLIARPYPTAVAGGFGWSASFPASNLTNNDYGRVAATGVLGAGASVQVVLDLGSAKTIDTLAALWHNGANGDTFQIAASNNADMSAKIYNSAALSARQGQTMRDVLPLWKSVYTIPPVTARYWAITFTTSASKPAGFQMSRMFVGKGSQFVIGPQKATLGAKDMNANITTEVGEQRSQEDQNLIRPAISLSFEYAKQSEIEEVLGQYTLALGVSKPMLVCTDLTSVYTQDNVAFGRPEKVVTVESSVYDVWSFEAVVTSLGI